MLNKAINIAKQINVGKYRLACIITDKRSRIISSGVNSYTKTHPRQAYYAKRYGNRDRIFLHAELDAIIHCYEKPYAIYIARVNKKGLPCLAKPCKICQMAIKDVGIKKIVYTS